jgi:beta-galactosidase GanA
MKVSKTKFLFYALIALDCAMFCGVLAAQTPPPIPRLVHTGSHYQLLVNGKPFLMLGGQAHNSSASSPQDLDPVWRSLVAMHANTAEVPLYWEMVEPQPEHFDFHLIDAIIHGARRHGLHLVLLWFGTWKNGAMTYTPEWVKENPTKYSRVLNELGQPMQIISPLCDAAREADAQAFAAVMKHIKSVDATERTVIMMQVENETGLLGTDRDYSPLATKEYNAQVPAELMTYLEGHRDNLMPALEAAWSSNHYAKSGNWSSVFGDLAPEAFSAWYVARYVNAVAAAGKKQYPLPMYCNNWLAQPGNARAGDFPSEGPTIHVLDIWKAAAPSIDILAPDIYVPEFLETSAGFYGPDNPLFVPETAFRPSYASYVFPDLAGFDGIGFSPFGIDFAVGKDGKLNSAGQALAENYKLLQPLLPMIAKYQGTGELFPIIQGVDRANTIYLGHELAAVVAYSQGRVA